MTNDDWAALTVIIGGILLGFGGAFILVSILRFLF